MQATDTTPDHRPDRATTGPATNGSRSAVPGRAASPRNAANTGADEREWTIRLASLMSRSRTEFGSRLHTTLACRLDKDAPVLLLPPEMAALQPRCLMYLRAFARRHGFRLIEDRRKVDVIPMIEQRGHAPGPLALGISRLLEQTGMPGGARTLSRPHRLAAGSAHLELDELVRIAARVRADSKRVVILPNRLIVEATGQDTHPIVAHGCRVETAATATVLTQFESPSFRAIGYSTGRQYVVHVFLAGGLAGNPGLWTRLHTLTNAGFRFRLFPGKHPSHDFGLLHTTLYYDVAKGADAPWWVRKGQREGARTATLRKAEGTGPARSQTAH